MKKQKKPSIKAHLLWSALILLSLLAVCAIPFALAQRQAAKQSVPNLNAPAKKDPAQAAPPSSGAIGATSQIGQSQRPTVSTTAIGIPKIPILPYPKAPQVVLYDQYNNGDTTASLSATFT